MKGSDASFQLLACRHVQKQTKTLLAHIEGIRTGDDIESIHQARVASRRICTALGVFKTAFPAKKVQRWDKHIRRLTKGLGAARDKDVQIEFVAGMVADRTPEKGGELPGLKRLLLRLRQEREAIQPRVIKTLDRLEAAGTLPEMQAHISKSSTRLRNAGTDPKSPFVKERGVRDIRRTCNKLLRLQSCLEDAEALEQHHRMRIAAKTLRYTMELYRKVFDKRLNEAIKVVRNVQTLLGDIHDCDVWCELVQTFTQEERERTIEYYGHAKSFYRLRPGFEYLRNERAMHRGEKFDELAALWKDLQGNGFWEKLIVHLEAPLPERDSRASDDVSIPTQTPTSETIDTSESHDIEKAGPVSTNSTDAKSAEISDERTERSLLPVSEPGEEESQSFTSTDEESKPEIDGASPSPAPETIPVFDTPRHEVSSLTDHTATHPTASDRPGVSGAPSIENAICECCGQNSFLQDELMRIDSGQFLCPGCLGEFHEKADHMAKS